MKPIHTFILGGAVLVLFITGAAVFAQNDGGGELFTDLPPSAQPLVESGPDGPEVMRTRFTGINLPSTERLGPGGKLVLSFFEDTHYTLVVQEASREGGFVTLTGQVEELEHSMVAVTIGGGQMVLDLISAQSVYQVRHVDGGMYVINQIDQSVFPDELPPVEVTENDLSAGSPAAVADLNVPSADDGSNIDVYVLYTAQARLAAGGTTQIQNLINQAAAATNQSYADSDMVQRISLVGMSETSYVESGDMGLDLSRLRSTSDGYMDNAHTLRDDNKADLVDLVVGSGQYCGIAYMMSSVSGGFESWAFSVVHYSCAVGNMSFAHELGHNMGARHDWFVDGNQTPYRYSHGHINLNDHWRTIMSYSNYCSDNGTYCNRIPFWSNPDITYGGDPMGVPEFTCTGSVGCDADNARTLDNTRVTVANFRAGTPPTATPTPTKTSTPTRTPTPTITPTPTNTPPYTVLLVDDKGDLPEVIEYYATPLATINATVSVWDTGFSSSVEPNATQMAPYEAVIWFTGDNFSDGTGPSDVAELNLADWLNAGGCLLISSQDYAFAYNPTNEIFAPNQFMADYLGVSTLQNDENQTTVTGIGLPFNGFGPYVLETPAGFAGNYSDIITPVQKAKIAFQGNMGPVGVAYEGNGFKTTYLGFPFEMIDVEDHTQRTDILRRFLYWCRNYDIFLPFISR